MPTPFLFAPTPHTEASAFVRAKPSVKREVLDAMLPEIKARAFVVSVLESLETAKTIREAIAAVPEGADWSKTKQTIADLLDHDLGEDSESRAELLLRTHVFQAYAAADYRMRMEELAVFPYTKYMTMQDDRVRDSHAALDGLILPADDPFWEHHTPPWDWGCRCMLVPMSREEVEGIKADESDLPPEQRTVLDNDSPARLQRIRAGHLDRQLPAEDTRGTGVGLAQLGQAKTWDVQSEFQKGREGAFTWNPGDLRMPVDTIKDRYHPKDWAAFERAMKDHVIEELPGQPSAWEWLTTPQPAWEKQVADKTRATAIAAIETGLAKRPTGEIAVAVDAEGVNYAVKQVEGTTMRLTADELQQFAGKTGIQRILTGRLAQLRGLRRNGVARCRPQNHLHHAPPA